MTNPYQAPSATHSASDTLLFCVGGCGKKLHITAASCPQCGAMQRTRSYKSKTTAALLAFFLGAFGIHRFYLGQWWGIFYLLFCWTGISGLVAFIEFIVFLASNQLNWDNKHNEGRPAAIGENKSSAVAIILVVIGVVMFIGILAAIALPAYQDYTMRAKVTQTMQSTQVAKNKVAEYIQQHQVMPNDLTSVGLNEPYLIAEDDHLYIDGSNLVIRFSDKSMLLDQKTIVLTPYLNGDSLQWDCRGGDLAKNYRSPACR